MVCCIGILKNASQIRLEKGSKKTMQNFKELLQQSGMSRTQFSKHFEIPYRTIQNWELGLRKCPDYLLKLMQYKLENEQKKEGNQV